MTLMLLTKNKYNYSDLLTLAQLIAGPKNALFIFDPNDKVNWDIQDTDSEQLYKKKTLINFGENLMRFKEFELSEFDFIIDFSESLTLTDFNAKEYKVVQASNGVLRYFFSPEEKSYSFLNFLATPTFRSKLIKKTLKFGLKLIGSRLFNKSFRLLSKSTPSYLKELAVYKPSFVNVFLGTPGYNRKPVAQLIKDNQIIAYSKIAISNNTLTIIQRERLNIKRMYALNLEGMNIPEILMNPADPSHYSTILTAKAPQSLKLKNTNNLTPLHLTACVELINKSMQYKQLADTEFYKEINEHLYNIRNTKTTSFNKLGYQLELLKQKLITTRYIKTTVAHGDFTPWNTIIQNNNTLYTFDWEMAMQNAPLFYDIFHYIVQSEILVNRTGGNQIAEKIEAVMEHNALQPIIQKHGIDVSHYYELYLLHAISKNINIFSKQLALSADQEILLKNWTIMLSNLQLKETATNDRTIFLEQLQQQLVHVNYAALKFDLPNFASLPKSSDLDLAIEFSELPTVLHFITNHLAVKRIETIEKSFMTIVAIYFTSGEFLSIDFIHEFKRKATPYLDCKELLKNSVTTDNLKRPFLLDDIAYAQFFYTLNKSNIPLKYQYWFTKQIQNANYKNEYLSKYSNIYQTKSVSISETFVYSIDKENYLKQQIKANFKTSIFKKIKNQITYLKDIKIDLSKNKGFLITFSGVDGTGKTTIIDLVKKELEIKYRKKVILLRHRPGVLPILSAIKHGGKKNAERKASERLPRQGKNKNILSSTFRFCYYYLDYLIGQLYVYCKYILRGKIVIYDRYYYDFINDAKRSNINLEPHLIKPLFKLIHKPAYNFYLYNTAEVILSRKQELSATDINTLNDRYFNTFNEFKTKYNGVYSKIKNDDKQTTVATILQTVHKSA